jgi:hypothetical protein
LWLKNDWEGKLGMHEMSDMPFAFQSWYIQGGAAVYTRILLAAIQSSDIWELVANMAKQQVEYRDFSR